MEASITARTGLVLIVALVIQVELASGLGMHRDGTVSQLPGEDVGPLLTTEGDEASLAVTLIDGPGPRVTSIRTA